MTSTKTTAELTQQITDLKAKLDKVQDAKAAADDHVLELEQEIGTLTRELQEMKRG